MADRRDASANRKPAIWKWVRHSKHHATLQRSTERARSASGEFEPHRRRCDVEVQFVAVGFDFKT
ncbi:MAG: hypothetical protein ACJAZD_002162 [Ilumatobacter sp.]|jgi:hypothetical protein